MISSTFNYFRRNEPQATLSPTSGAGAPTISTTATFPAEANAGRPAATASIPLEAQARRAPAAVLQLEACAVRATTAVSPLEVLAAPPGALSASATMPYEALAYVRATGVGPGYGEGGYGEGPYGGSGLHVEAIALVSATVTFSIEGQGLPFVQATASFPIEAGAARVSPSVVAVEAGADAVGSGALPLEGLADRVTVASAPVAVLASETASADVPLEASTTAAAVATPPVEALADHVAVADMPLEADAEAPPVGFDFYVRRGEPLASEGSTRVGLDYFRRGEPLSTLSPPEALISATAEFAVEAQAAVSADATFPIESGAEAGELALILEASDPDNTDASVYTTVPITPPGNAGILVAVFNSKGSAPDLASLATNPPSWLDGGWTLEEDEPHASVNMRLTVFSGKTVASPSADDIQATFPAAQTGCTVAVVSATDEDALDFVLQPRSGQVGSAGAMTAALTGDLAAATSQVVGFFGINASTNITPADGETELMDVGHSSPTRQLQVQHKLNDTSSSVTYASTSGGVWVVLELKAAVAGGIISTATFPVEGGASLAAAAEAPVEANAEQVSALALSIEGLLETSATATEPLETLVGQAAPALTPVEALQEFAEAVTFPIEIEPEPGVVIASATFPVESLTGVQAVSELAVEAEALVAASLDVWLESIADLAESLILPLESETGHASVTGVSLEGLVGDVSSAELPVEAGAFLVSTLAGFPFSVLAEQTAIVGVPLEAVAVGSSVSLFPLEQFVFITDVFVTGHFDSSTPSGGSDAGSPSAGHFDAPSLTPQGA